MKKKFYFLLAVVCCIALMTGCSFFSKQNSSTIGSEAENTADNKENKDDDPVDVPDDAQDVPVNDPTDNSEEDNKVDQPDSNPSKAENPQENVANDTDKKFTTTGKYCGFADSHSVEIELADGTFWNFFVFDEAVTNTLSSLNEENMPEITFTYQAMEGQINPEIIDVKAN